MPKGALNKAERNPVKDRRQAPAVDVWSVARCWVNDHPALDGKGETSHKQLLGHIRGRDWKALAKVGSDYEHAKLDAQTYSFYAQLRAFFKKNDQFASDQECALQARLNFERAEKKCRITNRRIDWFSQHEDRLDDELREAVRSVRAVIARICGSVDVWREGIPQSIEITSGATASSPRARSLPYMKLRKTYRATVGAHPYVEALVRFFTGKSPRIVQTSCNRIELVPKDSLTHRTIACEPEGNLPFQLSIDAFWKERLRSVGIDLSSQEQNRELARLGSIDGSTATIDLSMASDTVALNLVLWLFPDDWVEVLMALRTPAYKGVFGYGLYSKFSSMGNGYTFCIETILFYAIVVACGSSVCSVYGDDIICDADRYDAVVRLLRFFGMMPNLSKSFATGPFRESCGKDWFSGIDVRPFHLRRAVERKNDVCHVLNGLIGISAPGSSLRAYCFEVMRKLKLPLVPVNESSMSGIHVHPTDAYENGLVRSVGGVVCFRGYSEKTVEGKARGDQAYWLWFLRVYRERLLQGPENVHDAEFQFRSQCGPRWHPAIWDLERNRWDSDAVVTSGCPTDRTKVRKGMHVWRLPDMPGWPSLVGLALEYSQSC